MSRRRASRQDSLELLLDTICNTFGGVLFIAILVVLLLQQTGGGPEAPTVEPASPVELQALVIRLESVAADLARLRQNRDSQQAVVRDFAPKTILDQIARLHVVTAAQEALQTVVDQLLAGNAALARQTESLAARNETVQEDLRAALARHKQAQADLERERQGRVEEIRMPVVRPAGRKQEVALILRYGRLYVWHKYGPGHVRLGLNTDDFVVLSEGDDALATRPNPAAGTALNDSTESRQAVRRVLQRFDKRTCNLGVVVRPDSYAVFRYLRDQAIGLGFDYRLVPVDADTALTDRGGDSKGVQ